MSRSKVQRLLARKFRPDGSRLTPDDLIVEEPLTIELDGVTVANTMRTPGNDFELAAGFCLTEGLIEPGDIQQIRYCGTGSAVATEFNVVSISTGGRAAVATERQGLIGSACGICGSDVVHELEGRIGALPEYEPWDQALLVRLVDLVDGHQPLHEATGAVHLAAAFDRQGRVVVAREDIGRHNAVDKVIGRLLLDGALPAAELAMFVSSRASFEMVQKAWAGGFPALVAVSGPSALAVNTARRAGMTLVGFARSGTANFYSPEGI